MGVRRGPAAASTSGIDIPSATGSGSCRSSATNGFRSSATSTKSGSRASSCGQTYAASSPVPVVRMPLPIVLRRVPRRSDARISASRPAPRSSSTCSTCRARPSARTRSAPSGRSARPGSSATRRCWCSSSPMPSTIATPSAACTKRPTGLNVVMLDGYIGSRRDLARSIDAADCYLSPHRSEGFGLTMLEAMRLGKPVIATALLRQHGLHDRRTTASRSATAWSTLDARLRPLHARRGVGRSRSGRSRPADAAGRASTPTSRANAASEPEHRSHRNEIQP